MASAKRVRVYSWTIVRGVPTPSGDRSDACSIRINFVVNRRTFLDPDAATSLAAEVGATQEFLLLPEQPTQRSEGIDRHTADALGGWVHPTAATCC